MPSVATDRRSRLFLTIVCLLLMVASLFGMFFGFVLITLHETPLGLVIGLAFFMAAIAVFVLCATGMRTNHVPQVVIAVAISLVLLISHQVLTEVF